MDKQLYIDYLKETADQATPIILDLVDAYKGVDEKLHQILMHFVGRRLNKPLLKPALLRATYELCGGRDWQRILPASAAFELINISSYQANSAFDGKLRVLTPLEKEAQFIAAMISRELAQQAVDRLQKDFSLEQVTAVSRCLAKSNEFIYQAQHWDLNLLTWDNLDKYRDEHFFLQEYTKRCFYGSGVFTGQCAIAGAILAGAPNSTIEALKVFGESYGTALHMINDIGDFVTAPQDNHTPKDYQDKFSDFRNRRLTLPIYHLLRSNNTEPISRVKTIASLGSRGEPHFDEVVTLLKYFGCFTFAERTALLAAVPAKESLGSFARSEARDLLAVMLSAIESNKYLHSLKQVAGSIPKSNETTPKYP